MAKRGIDISEHQGEINLRALKNQIDFVIIRVGFGPKGTIDGKFKRNADLCTELGIPMGFYWYSYALNVADANNEAVAFLDAIAPYKPTYGCWFDMEDADGYKKKHSMPSNQTLRNICSAWCEAVEGAGYYSGVYASQSWFNNQLKGEELKPYDKWVAQWPTSMGKQKGINVLASSKDGVSMWQFTSEGKLNGYNGSLDMNYAYHEFPNPKIKGVETPDEAAQPTQPIQPARPIEQKFKIGETVVLNGPLFVSSNANDRAGEVKNKVTNITRFVPGALHPYNTTDDLGWMNESDIAVHTEKTEAAKPITKGCKVKFIGTKSYSGLKLASWVTGSVFNVIELSGNRAVIGKGSAVTAAVNIRDCQRL